MCDETDPDPTSTPAVSAVSQQVLNHASSLYTYTCATSSRPIQPPATIFDSDSTTGSPTSTQQSSRWVAHAQGSGFRAWRPVALIFHYIANIAASLYDILSENCMIIVCWPCGRPPAQLYPKRVYSHCDGAHIDTAPHPYQHHPAPGSRGRRRRRWTGVQMHRVVRFFSMINCKAQL